MSLKITSICLLLISVGLCSHVSAGRLPSKNRPCCVGVTNRNISSEVTEETYYEQTARPPCVEAIIFKTDSGSICANPKAQWVQNIIASMTKV
ncbi:chemokine (C-C motif) ligand 34b, duplicate 4 [Pholidichthys leucotaenia]